MPLVLEFWGSFSNSSYSTRYKLRIWAHLHPNNPVPYEVKYLSKIPLFAEMNISPHKNFTSQANLDSPFETDPHPKCIFLWPKCNPFESRPIKYHKQLTTPQPKSLHYLCHTAHDPYHISAHLSSLSFLDTTLSWFSSHLFRLNLLIVLRLGYFVNSMTNGISLLPFHTLPPQSNFQHFMLHWQLFNRQPSRQYIPLPNCFLGLEISKSYRLHSIPAK